MRTVHNDILVALDALNHGFLKDHRCFFGGGTAISLMLDGYRISSDIDFLCASASSYRDIRRLVLETPEVLLGKQTLTASNLRVDAYSIRVDLSINDTNIRFEIVREERIPLMGHPASPFAVPMLSIEDLFAEKLLANADRWLDKGVNSRDIIDLGMMVSRIGDVPTMAWEKAHTAYGANVAKSFERAVQMLDDSRYFLQCLKNLDADIGLQDEILSALKGVSIVFLPQAEGGLLFDDQRKTRE
ncbi:nucleotidyl transferase AbiEii/AbiGii toxin family protein [Thalassospira xianhensis]|uniref:nucleotidyl transferase AbiEii/AbiGii toxin family protein n=1 Tax=Thalassospira xianhensis TaxID=478503 RepID=UPI00142D61B4|nr:nucleotidyl transferase AbiEii/AbiGii toxin family protein [Thalassospira xianhensis]